MGNQHTTRLHSTKSQRLKAAALLVAILSAGAFFTWWTVVRTNREMRSDLLVHTRLVANSLNFESIKALSGTKDDLKSLSYRNIKEQFTSLCSSDPQCRFIYLMGRRTNGSVFMFVDSEPVGSKDYSPPGQIYEEATEELRRVFDAKTETVEGPVADRWGMWVSALIPVSDPQTGAVLAVLGMDIDANTWKWNIAAQSALPVAVMLILLISMTAIFLSIRRADASIRAQQAALRESEERYRLTFENVADVIYVIDADLTILNVSPSVQRILGYKPQEFIGRPVSDLARIFTAESFEQAMADIGLIYKGETIRATLYQFIAKDGTIKYGEVSGSPVMRDDKIVSIISVARDITERKQAEEKIRQMAYHDSLTGLPNRKLFSDRLGIALPQAQRNKKGVGIAMLDLDNFKGVNDTLGHATGDLLLKAVSERLTAALRKSDTVARIGGDEFVLMLPDLKGPGDAIQVAQKVVKNFHKPFLIGTHQLFVTTSIGIAVYPNDGTDEDTLMKNADTAMYQAKKAGRDRYQIYKHQA